MLGLVTIVFSHLSSGDLTQAISTGLTILDRMTINTNGNVGIGIGNAGALLHVSGTTILNNITTLHNTSTVSGNVKGAPTAGLAGECK